MAPSRYQFTETTLTVKMDLGQSMQLGGTLGLGGSIGAVALNAAIIVGYGYDYRAAAEVRTVLHAIPAETDTFKTLLARAKELSDDVLTLPPGIDLTLAEKSRELIEKIGNLKLPQTKAETDAAKGD